MIKWDITGMEVWVKIYKSGLAGGTVVENPPCNARDMGLIPGWGSKIPHASEQLSSCATTKILCAATRTWGSQTNK